MQVKDCGADGTGVETECERVTEESERVTEGPVNFEREESSHFPDSSLGKCKQFCLCPSSELCVLDFASRTAPGEKGSFPFPFPCSVSSLTSFARSRSTPSSVFTRSVRNGYGREERDTAEAGEEDETREADEGTAELDNEESEKDGNCAAESEHGLSKLDRFAVPGSCASSRLDSVDGLASLGGRDERERGAAETLDSSAQSPVDISMEGSLLRPRSALSATKGNDRIGIVAT
ncbi:hypothetical protein TGMAS_271015 [Toxoplasma gondii MAS]|uniref:Uncharacterized protein n=1 Tax=Toxoplasma gondii MAS TaxID=943118 RepID=A0A086QVG6_TOXGO|nr:hypothetical protein TGMAS_271015 [Toxoplasma gondii MAS]